MSEKRFSFTLSSYGLKDRHLFNNIAGAYSRKDMLPAHRKARKLRLEQTISAIPISSNVSILEVGCGAGFSAEYLKGKYKEYHGIDYSAELINYAIACHMENGVKFTAINIKDFKTDKRFDVILMIGVLHHLEDVSSMMRHIESFLKPRGWILANEPHAGNPLIRSLRAIRKRIDSEYSSDQRELTIPQLLKIYRESKLEDIRIIPQGIFSTPFAEVVMPWQTVTTLLSRWACRADQVIEKNFGQHLNRVTWNIIIAGRKPGN